MKTLALGSLFASGLAGAVAIAAGSSATQAPAAAGTVTPEHLETAVRYNGTDDDAQILFFAKDEETARAMARVWVRGPDGRTLITDRVVGGRKIGQSVADIRTSQHRVSAIRRAYPPGTYRWSGVLANGRRFAGTSRLSYKLLDPPAISSPANGATGIPTSGARIEWQPVPGAEAIFVEVEDDTAGGRELLVRLDGDATSFAIPDQFLEASTEYAVELKALAPNGNQSAADSSFTTR